MMLTPLFYLCGTKEKTSPEKGTEREREPEVIKISAVFAVIEEGCVRGQREPAGGSGVL